MVSRKDRLAGGLLGLLIGDALGVPYEFQPPHHLPPIAAIEFEPPSGFERSHRGVPPGTWSDDGAQALCLLASLLECGRFDAEDLGRRLVKWYEQGYMAVEGEVFDVGIQTGRALLELRRGAPALQAGSLAEQSLGNGSLMRVLPLALWHRGSDAELVADARAQSRVTHGHPRAQLCCALYCLWARYLLEEATDPWQEAVDKLKHLLDAEPISLVELERNIRPDDLPAVAGGGYVVDCLRSVRRIWQTGTYEAVVKAAVALGNDTDTTACVAGGIAGVRDGLPVIPMRWRRRLRGRHLWEPLLDKLLAL